MKIHIIYNSMLPCLDTVTTRGRLETNTEQWLRLLRTMEDLLAWILKAQHELKAQRPVGGDHSSLHKQMEANQVSCSCFPLMLGWHG